MADKGLKLDKPEASDKKAVDKKADGAKRPKKAKVGLFSRIKRFFKDLRSETKKVVWPTKKQIINNTIVVIVVMLCLGIVIWGLDAGLSALVNLVLKSA